MKHYHWQLSSITLEAVILCLESLVHFFQMQVSAFRCVVWSVLSSIAFRLETLGHGADGGDEEDGASKLIVVSFDGFRWDYLLRTKTTHFSWIISNGVHARLGIKSSFITKTLPNHFTLATGLYEESHGIVGNTMYDPALNESFDVHNKQQVADPRWFDVGGEPIWVTNQLQKKNGRSGCMQWIGCEAPIKGVTPTRHIPYTPSMSNESRIDTLIDWFTGSYPINLGLLYFQEPDGTAHKFGPDSRQVKDMVNGLDKVVGYLLKQLEVKGLLNDTNLIITSDHGFTTTGPEHVIRLYEYIKTGTYRVFSSNPVAAILPNEGLEDEIFSNLSSKAQESGNFRVYRNNTVPEEYHYKHNPRIMPIIVEAKENYSIIYDSSAYVPNGNHGYNNSRRDMNPFFLAMGPGFRKGVEIQPFKNVDIYPLMCHLLGLHPAPNNGSLDLLRPLLLDQDDKTTVMTFSTYFFVLSVIATVGGLFAVAACRQHRYLKRMQRSRIISLQGSVKYSTPPSNGGAKVPLLTDTSEEESMP